MQQYSVDRTIEETADVHGGPAPTPFEMLQQGISDPITSMNAFTHSSLCISERFVFYHTVSATCRSPHQPRWTHGRTHLTTDTQHDLSATCYLSYRHYRAVSDPQPPVQLEHPYVTNNCLSQPVSPRPVPRYLDAQRQPPTSLVPTNRSASTSTTTTLASASATSELPPNHKRPSIFQLALTIPAPKAHSLRSHPAVMHSSLPNLR